MKEINNRYKDKIPRAIYYECIWIIRDKNRLEKILINKIDEYGELEKNAYERLDSIHRALLKIPREYREAIIKSINHELKNTNIYLHENTLRKYKRMFIYHLAKNLNLY